jgi:hypothetical protein
MTNSNTMKGLTYSGIAIACVLGVYLLFKTKNIVTDPKVQSAAKGAYNNQAAFSDIVFKGKRNDTTRAIEGPGVNTDYFDGFKHLYGEGGSRKCNRKHRKTKKYLKK